MRRPPPSCCPHRGREAGPSARSGRTARQSRNPFVQPGSYPYDRSKRDADRCHLQSATRCSAGFLRAECALPIIPPLEGSARSRARPLRHFPEDFRSGRQRVSQEAPSARRPGRLSTCRSRIAAGEHRLASAHPCPGFGVRDVGVTAQRVQAVDLRCPATRYPRCVQEGRRTDFCQSSQSQSNDGD